MKTYLTRLFTLCITLICVNVLIAQSPSAIVDFEATDKGILIPRTDTATVNTSFTPDLGLMIYQTIDNQFYYYNGSKWLAINYSNTISEVLEAGNDAEDRSILNLSNLAIGTDSPTDELEVVSASEGSFISIETEVENNAGIRFKSANQNWSMGYHNDEERFKINNGENLSSNVVAIANNGSFKVDASTFNVDVVNNRVGIGTSSPNEILHIETDEGEVFVNVKTTDDENSGLHFRSLNQDWTMGYDASVEKFKINNGGNLGSNVVSIDNGGNFTVDANTFNVDAINNKVGIGTDTPTTSLDIIGDARIDGNTFVVDSMSNSIGIGTDSPSDILDIQTASGASFINVETTADENSGIRFRSQNQDWAIGYHADDQTLKINAGGNLANNVVAIDNNGSFKVDGNTFNIDADNNRVGIGTSSPSADLQINQSTATSDPSTGGVMLKYDASVWQIYHGVANLNFGHNGVKMAHVDASTGDWVVNSDLRLKKNIRDMEPVLGKVKQLRPVKYHYNIQDESDYKASGFIAQEVAKLFPNIVSVSEDKGYLSIAYDNFAVLAIKSIQEQQEIIDTLQNKVEHFESELQELKKIISQQ